MTDLDDILTGEFDPKKDVERNEPFEKALKQFKTKVRSMVDLHIKAR